jgi:UDP-glucuronate 4-epimerase
VTGATGFVGANLVLHLAQQAHRVVAYDLAPPTRLLQSFWGPVEKQVVFKAGSVTDADRLTQIARRHSPDVIVHAAAITAVDPVREAQMLTPMVEANVMGTLRLLDLARELQVRRMIYVSSTGVYGTTDPQVPVPETAPIPYNALGTYEIAKEVSERLCLRYATLHGLDVVVGRLNGPYGPMEKETHMRSIMSPIFQLARAALTKGTVRLCAVDFQYSWTFTLDLARSIRLLVEAASLPNQIYNLSSGQPRLLSEVTTHLTRLIPGANFIWVDAAQSADVDFSNPIRRGPMDISRLRQDVGFDPVYDLERGLGEALPWWREMLLPGT